jgi:hypothetical protein
MEVKVGDVIEVQTQQVGQPARRGEVRDVISEQPLELLVAWDDGHESNFYPAAGSTRVVQGTDA